jgi:hypothetical protein
MLYLDTSLVVAALTREANTLLVQSWLAARDPDELAISDWVVTEFSAALSIKLRTGQLDAGGRAGASGVRPTMQGKPRSPADLRLEFPHGRKLCRYPLSRTAGR